MLWKDVHYIKEVLMSDENTFQGVTKRLFQQHLLREDETNAYCRQQDLAKHLRKIVEECVKKQGELFVSEVEIITELFSPLAKTTIEQIAKKHGFHAECGNYRRALKYLGSDGGGHYSTDYYHYLQYGRILVTLA